MKSERDCHCHCPLPNPMRDCPSTLGKLTVIHAIAIADRSGKVTGIRPAVIGNFMKDEDWGFELFGKARGGWLTAKSIGNICLLSLKLSKPSETVKDEASNHL